MFIPSAPDRQFIQQHLTDDVRHLLLRTHPPELPIRELTAQITARQKAKDKLPTWYANEHLVFPPALSVEQASSEAAARYKASLVSGHQLLDLTGGMGVDSWAFAERIERVRYVEHRPELAELAAYNLPRLGATNITVQTGDGLTTAQALTDPVDWLYLDPHRRNEQGGKVVRLADCEPDISQPDILDSLLAKASQVLLKASPLIDIDDTIRQLPGINAVHVVAVQGEVKEVLFVISSQLATAIAVAAVNLHPDRNIAFTYDKGDERMAPVQLGDPQTYLYEPNAAVLKAGAFRLVATRFGLRKLAPNSHLYTSSELVPDFPGRVFMLQTISKPDRKSLQQVLPMLKSNLTVRNFPQSVADLRKKLGLKEGGDTYIFATTLQNGDKRLLITHKSPN
ncbi:THUMP-like domain-containing protein [Spirosoma sp. KUDC1026]|uniref:THUMP-like domain-containing protein n=1 Tax=Spirosoma sp. KUDC1026 TaxID=2745947 RepID=UPI00293BB172|nr:SAM-dependent methyltransferase [Spirosoma sp. KUDC1026]